MQTRLLNTVPVAIIAAMLCATPVALAAPTPEQACQAAKSKAAGKYALCRQSAEGKLAVTGDVPKYSTDITKCGTQFTTAWQKAIDKATSLGGVCPDSALSASDYQTIITVHTSKVASGISGSSLEVCSVATPLRTGQTTCYTDMGAGLPCPGTGQDGELQKGIARSYTDNGNGTITDNITGLMWEKLTNDNTIHDKDDPYIWGAAFTTKIEALNTASFAGYTDWRLPNINEIQSLANYAAGNPFVDAPFNNGCGGFCDGILCSCTKSGLSWSSTSYLNLTTRAWGTQFATGELAHNPKNGTAFVRAVRESCNAAARPLKTGQVTCFDSSGAPIGCDGTGQDGELKRGTARSYTDNGNGTITDLNTGLTWEKLSNDNTEHDRDALYPWIDSMGVKIQGLNMTGFGGRSDWRLPNANELLTLINYGAANPAVDAIFNSLCPGGCTPMNCSCTKSGFYWSSTTYESSPYGVYGSFFDRGDLQFGSKIPGDYVRAVAGGS